MDSGVGMSESEIDRLFGEGVQFNANDLQAGKGSGLGLFISKNLAEQHGGSLTARSEGIGKGSAFTLQLPLYQCDIASSSNADEHQDLEEYKTESSLHHEKRQLRILVVDDIVTNRKLLSRLLERNGHECSMAENGEVAVTMVRENMSSKDGATRLYDCILMDYEMPVLNGPNATEKIREMGCNVLIVGITGNTLSDDVQYFESKGANKVLAKPVKIDVLENLFVEYGV
jgi:CheY-like chemotaxis protein